MRLRVRHKRAARRRAAGGKANARGRRGPRRLGEGEGMTDVRKILVVGGGIGGLCTTIALCRAGFDVDLVEKNPAWDVYGVGIIQPGNALRALNELGLAKEAVAQGHQTVGDRTWRTAGFVPLADDLMYMLTIEKPPDGQPLKPPTNGIAARYRGRLQTFGGPVAEQRERVVDDEAVVYRPVENVLVPPPWYRGRVVLIGDAAHATTPHCGQGAAQAIEDGIVLAEELNSDQALDAALERYMERRHDRCRMIVEGS